MLSAKCVFSETSQFRSWDASLPPRHSTQNLRRKLARNARCESAQRDSASPLSLTGGCYGDCKPDHDQRSNCRTRSGTEAQNSCGEEPTTSSTAQANQERRYNDGRHSAGRPAPPARSRYSIARGLTLLSALGLASISGFFSIVGLTSIFLGSLWPVIAMGSVFEVAKLSAVALLGQRRIASRALKFAIVTLIAALMTLNVVGAYGFLARAQISHAVSGEVQIADHAAQVEARMHLAAADVADIDRRIGQIDDAIVQATKRGRTASAMTLAEHQTARRDALVGAPQARWRVLKLRVPASRASGWSAPRTSGQSNI